MIPNELMPIITAIAAAKLIVTWFGLKNGELSTQPKHTIYKRNADAKNSARNNAAYHVTFLEFISISNHCKVFPKTFNR